MQMEKIILSDITYIHNDKCYTLSLIYGSYLQICRFVASILRLCRSLEARERPLQGVAGRKILRECVVEHSWYGGRNENNGERGTV